MYETRHAIEEVCADLSPSYYCESSGSEICWSAMPQRLELLSEVMKMMNLEATLDRLVSRTTRPKDRVEKYDAQAHER